MDKWLVDVPVCLFIWTRPQIQKLTFAAIKKAKPSVLFLISDGPRNEEERELIMESRKVVEDIDWECQVHKLYMNDNQGMYTTGKKGLDYVFSVVDRCILLEDDILASVSFFRFCAELLEKYKDDLRVTAINGMNYKGIYGAHDADYFFTWGNAISGGALWKRTYEKFYDMSAIQDTKLHWELAQYAKHNPKDRIAEAVRRNTVAYAKNPYYQNHAAGAEFYRSFINVTESQLDIVPSKNMITNLGLVNGTHIGDIKLMPKKYQKLFNQKRYEVEFPLKHPKYFIRDLEYEERIESSKIERMMLKAEVLIRNMIFLPPREFWKKVLKKVKNKREVEK